MRRPWSGVVKRGVDFTRRVDEDEDDSERGVGGGGAAAAIDSLGLRTYVGRRRLKLVVTPR